MKVIHKLIWNVHTKFSLFFSELKNKTFKNILCIPKVY